MRRTCWAFGAQLQPGQVSPARGGDSSLQRECSCKERLQAVSPEAAPAAAGELSWHLLWPVPAAGCPLALLRGARGCCWARHCEGGRWICHFGPCQGLFCLAGGFPGVQGEVLSAELGIPAAGKCWLAPALPAARLSCTCGSSLVGAGSSGCVQEKGSHGLLPGGDTHGATAWFACQRPCRWSPARAPVQPGHPQTGPQHRISEALKPLWGWRLLQCPGQPGTGLHSPQGPEIVPHV